MALAAPVFVNHAHVFPASVRPDGTVTRLLQLMDQCGIDRAVAFAPFSYQLKRTDIECNSWLEKAIQPYSDRLVGFGTIDFSGTAIDQQVQAIHAMGFRGIKLHPAAQSFHLLSEEAFAVYAEAEKLGLFLSFHTGVHWHRLESYRVTHYDEIAHHFPALKFSMEHVGGYHFFLEAVAVMVNNSRQGNIYAGLTSVFDREKQRYWYLGPEKVHDLIWQVGDDNLVFGLDFPYNKEPEIMLAMRAVDALGLSAEQRQKVMGDNLASALGFNHREKVG